jgi:Fur family transcriptional regulator, ferric uptake regulator
MPVSLPSGPMERDRAVGDRLDRIMSLLRQEGGRVTPSRKAVVRALLDAGDHHATAADIVATVREGDPDFQESTVYRTLDRLAELGVVHHVHMGHGAAVYHLTDEAHGHHHLLCNRCERVFEVSPTLLQSTVRRIERDTGFVVDPGHFALTGLCSECHALSGTDPY